MRWASLCVVSTVACAGGTAANAALSRVDGELRIGPTQPVCQADVPCDAPLSAGFTLRQAGRVRSHFHSDAAGRFTATLPIGTYDAVLDPDAPASVLGSQTQSVTVGPDSVSAAKPSSAAVYVKLGWKSYSAARRGERSRPLTGRLQCQERLWRGV